MNSSWNFCRNFSVSYTKSNKIIFRYSLGCVFLAYGYSFGSEICICFDFRQWKFSALQCTSIQAYTVEWGSHVLHCVGSEKVLLEYTPLGKQPVCMYLEKSDLNKLNPTKYHCKYKLESCNENLRDLCWIQICVNLWKQGSNFTCKVDL